MVADGDEVARTLEGGLLAGREVHELSTDWGLTFAVDIRPEQLREAWREARELVPELGRWPVAATGGWDGVVDERIFTRFPFLYGQADNSPQAICDRTRTLTREDALARPLLLHAERYYARDWGDVVAFQLE